MKAFFIIIAILLPLAVFGENSNQTPPPIAGGQITGKFNPFPIIIPKAFSTAEAAVPSVELHDVLNADLYNSDLFEIIDASPYPPYKGQQSASDYKNSRAAYAALMKASLNGNEIDVEARLYDVKSQQLIIGKLYKWDKKFVRQIAHRFADEII